VLKSDRPSAAGISPAPARSANVGPMSSRLQTASQTEPAAIVPGSRAISGEPMLPS